MHLKFTIVPLQFLFIILLTTLNSQAIIRGLHEIKKTNKLIHIGYINGNFIIPVKKEGKISYEGFSVDILKEFANFLKVQYTFKLIEHKDAIKDLIGKEYRVKNNNVELIRRIADKGDILACGITMKSWHNQLLNYSKPIFPNQVLLMARADLSTTPIIPDKNGNIAKDIMNVKSQIKNLKIFGKVKSIGDPALYDISKFTNKKNILLTDGSFMQIAGALIEKKAPLGILDVPNALTALDKYHGKIKVIGPLSPKGSIGIAFKKESSKLKTAFSNFLNQIISNGKFFKFLKKYYPAADVYFYDFFKNI